MRKLMILFSLTSCVAATQAPVPISNISDKEAFALARIEVLASLRDPDSAKFGPMTRKRVKLPEVYRLTTIGLESQADVVCGSINSKNGFGGYSGARLFVYRIVTKTVSIDEGNPKIATAYCEQGEQIK